MKKLIAPILLSISMLAAANGWCEDVVIYSYTGLSQQDWVVMPVIADLKDDAPATLFDSLRRRKMPTYGTTSFDASKNIVQIDTSKCAYASIISAEIEQTFAAHHHNIPRVMCGQNVVPQASSALSSYQRVMPLWQALGGAADKNAIVVVANDYLPMAEFQKRLGSKDKSLAKTIEAGFSDPNSFVKSGLMQGYIAQKFPGAEKRVAQELNASNTANINAAMGALAGTKDPVIIRQMVSVMQKPGSMQEAYAMSLLGASAPEIRSESMRILLKSPNDAAFNKAYEAAQNEPGGVISKYAEELLNAATPSHARILAEWMLNHQLAEPLANWLFNAPTSEAPIAAAEVALQQAKDISTKHTVSTRQMIKQAALSMLVTADRSETAFDALDDLQLDEASQSSVMPWLHGLSSGYSAIRIACAHHISRMDVQDEASRTLLMQAVSEKKYHADLYASEIAISLAGITGSPKDALKGARSNDEKRIAYVAMPSDMPELQKPVANAEIEGGRLLGLARQHVDGFIAQIDAKIHHDNPSLRRDAAVATRWMDTAGDALRTALIRDNDETVIEAVIRQFPFRPADEISTAMVRDLTARVERSHSLKMAVLAVLPEMMNEKTSHVITTYVSNEMFDDNIHVRIAAIRALSRIAVVSQDPVVVDNAITSLALTAQDKSPTIVYHTITALARTHNPSAADIIRRAKTTHPDSYRRALELYPFDK